MLSVQKSLDETIFWVACFVSLCFVKKLSGRLSTAISGFPLSWMRTRVAWALKAATSLKGTSQMRKSPDVSRP